MGAWGFLVDQNDSTADAWDRLDARFFAKFKIETQDIKSTEMATAYVRAHAKEWYEVLIQEIVRLVSSNEWGTQSPKVALSLIVQTVRLMTSDIDQVDFYFIGGISTRIQRIDAELMQSDEEQIKNFPKILPKGFPCELRHYAREANKLKIEAYEPTSANDAQRPENARKVQARLFQ
jgi:hypothetical protein